MSEEICFASTVRAMGESTLPEDNLAFFFPFACSIGCWCRCAGVKFILSSWYGGERHGPGLWAGRAVTAVSFLCLFSNPALPHWYLHLGGKKQAADYSLEIFSLSVFKYLVLKEKKGDRKRECTKCFILLRTKMHHVFDKEEGKNK